MDDGLKRHISGPLLKDGDLWTGYFLTGQDALSRAKEMRAMAEMLVTFAERLEECFDERPND